MHQVAAKSQELLPWRAVASKAWQIIKRVCANQSESVWISWKRVCTAIETTRYPMEALIPFDTFDGTPWPCFGLELGTMITYPVRPVRAGEPKWSVAHGVLTKFDKSELEESTKRVRECNENSWGPTFTHWHFLHVRHHMPHCVYEMKWKMHNEINNIEMYRNV